MAAWRDVDLRHGRCAGMPERAEQARTLTVATSAGLHGKRARPKRVQENRAAPGERAVINEKNRRGHWRHTIGMAQYGQPHVRWRGRLRVFSSASPDSRFFASAPR